MKSNDELQKNVQNAIKWEPLLNNAEIDVTAKDGVITLTGTVDHYLKKTEAENAAKNVIGVKAVIEKIEVNYGDDLKKEDSEIALEIANAIKLNPDLPNDELNVKVENGWVVIDGDVKWNFQKDFAKRTIINLSGVRGVTNRVQVKQDAANERVERTAVEEALKRSWSINAEEIHVKVTGDQVRLTGVVRSIYQRDEAGRLAWNAPGVGSVENELSVEYN